MNEMVSYYVQINVLCILLMVGVNVALRGKNGFLPARRLAFSRLVLITSIVCLSDIGAWVLNGRQFYGARVLLEISNMVYFAGITWTCYAWMNYVHTCTRDLQYNYRRLMLLTAIPMFVMFALIAINPLTHFMFSIDAENVYHRGNGVFLHWIISWGYLLVTTIELLVLIRKSRSRVEKAQLIPMVWFAVMPAIGAMIQMIFYGVTTTQCGIVLSIVTIAFSVIRAEVSNDSLTGLNNRKAFENFVAERIQKPGRHYSVLLCDIDKFKKINDTQGHAAGDIALKCVADALKKACGRSQMPLFLCRYGGDEFVICGTDLEMGSVGRIMAILNQEVEAANDHNPEQLRLSISIGSAGGVCSREEEVEKLLEAADESMYRSKKSRGINRE